MGFRLGAAGKIRLRNGKLALLATVAIGGVAATQLAVTDFPDYTHYQRDATGAGKTISISGTCAGNPSAIQWRAVDWYTGTPISSWATLITSPGATFTASVYMPASKWAKIELRDSVNTGLTASTINRMAVGIKWLLIGQSNMFLRTNTASVSPTGSKQVLIFTNPNTGSSVIKRIGNYNDGIPVNSPSTFPGYSTGAYVQQVDVRGDAVVYFGNLLAETLGMAVMIIERAQSGSAIDEWMTGYPNGHWAKVVTAVTAVGGDVEGASWTQGESDAKTMSRATRLARMASLHGQLHSLTGRNSSTFKFAITTIGPGPYSSSTPGQFGIIREADNYYARTTPGAILATSAHDAATPNDTVHLDGDGYGRIGRREAKSVLAAFGVGVSGAGPRITGMTRSGAQVDVAIVHSGGSALTDGAGGTGSGLTGFQFTDAGNSNAAIAVTASTILNATTIRLTLASTPIGALSGSYAMSDVPNGVGGSTNTFVLASCVYDNATYFSSTIGCPLQPYAPTLVN